MPSPSRRNLMRVAAGLVCGLAGCQSQPSSTTPASPAPSSTPRKTTRTNSPTDTDTASPTPREAGHPCEKSWNPSVRWKSEHGGSPAVVTDESVYASSGNTLSAFDADSGAVQWHHEGEEFRGGTTPAVGGSVVIANTSRGLTAYDATSGRRTWQFRPAAENAVVHTSPVVTRGRVFVTVRRESETDHPDSKNPHKLYGLSLDDGEPVVTAELPDVIPKTIVTTDGRVYATVSDARLLAFDPESGERQWTRQLGSGEVEAYWQRPAVAGDTLYLTVAGMMVALSARDGTVHWRQAGRFVDNPAIGGDRLYSLAEDERTGGNPLVALDRSSGQKLWRAPLSADRPDLTTASSEDVFVSGGINGQEAIVAFDAETGCVLGTYDSPGLHATVSDETLYVGGHSMQALSLP